MGESKLAIHECEKLQLFIALSVFGYQVSLSPWKFKGESVPP